MHFSKSHIISMQPLAEALSLRGHNVTIYAAMQGEAAMPTKMDNGVTGRWVNLPKASEEDIKRFTKIVWTMDFGPMVMAWPFNLGNQALTKILTQQPDAWWSVANETWDMIFADELFSQSSYAMALMSKQRHGKPFAVFSTADMLSTFASINSLGRNPAVNPSFYTSSEPFSFDATSLLDRFYVTKDFIVEYLSVGLLSEYQSRSGVGQLGFNDFTWSSYFKEAQLIISDYPERMNHPVPTGNEIINIGATCSVSNDKMTQELLSFVNDEKSRGTIYIAFGSNVQWDYAPEHVLDAFLTTIEALKEYRIIWSYKGPQLKVSNHVKILAWAPQIAILNHPKTKLFISHGGLKSLKEAICSATPVVFMSIFAEQTHNALICNQLGFAEYVNKHTVTGADLLRQARKVLENDAYLANVRKVKAMNNDRIMPPLEEDRMFLWLSDVGKRSLRETAKETFVCRRLAAGSRGRALCPGTTMAAARHVDDEAPKQLLSDQPHSAQPHATEYPLQQRSP
uniref:glucuronosyltransferase n=1 Tax=Plectus sambesii TaxID=2011161 RepID=A0A914XNX7_9BILA